MNTSAIRRLSLAVVGSMLAACGGGGGSAPPPPPPPPANTPPVAAFAGAAAVAAGTPIVFDASGSTDANGDALTFSWDFGSGQRGGGQKIARIFTQPGTVAVRLTVDDGRGGAHSVERSVTVTAGPAAIGSVTTLAIVRDTSGVPLSDVTVAPVAGGASAISGADGRATIATDRGIAVVLRFSKAGYADQFKQLNLPAVAESGYLEVTLLPRELALTLPSAAAGGVLTGKDGARVTFAPNSLVDGAGNPVSGPVQVAITPVDVSRDLRAFPGKFEGLRTTGQSGLLLSYGTVEFALSAGGAPVQLAPGKKATIEIPIYTRLNKDGTPIAAGNAFPMWSLDERTGGWIEEGVGTVVAAATPSDFALRGEVTHFSWWNHDQFEFPPGRPKPKCLVDTNLDGVLEDLTGTGYCWHAGTGPEQPNNTANAAAADRVRPLAEPRTQRIPTYVAEATTPAAGGVVLPIPADMNITFRSYAKGGTLFGMKVVNLGPNVEQDVEILLAPVKQNSGTIAISALPYDDYFAMTTPGEIDRFTFAVEAGAQYEVTVSRNTASLLDGTARVLNGTTQLASGSFNQNAFATTQAASAAGIYTVEVVAGNNAPGAYRIQVRKLTNALCAAPIVIAVPSTTNNILVPAGGTRCLELALAADDIVQIVTTQNLNSEGVVRLFAPNGEEVGVDGYGTGSFDGIRLRAAVALTGTYRLEISNTRATAGTINGLAPSKLTAAGVLTVPQTVSFSAPAGGDSERYYVIKPASAGQSYALMLDPKGSGQGMDVRPSGFQTTAGEHLVMWPSAPAAAYTLVRVFRQNQNVAWDFDLSTSMPETLPLDTDIALNATGFGLVKVYRLDAVNGLPLSIGRQWSNAIDLNAVLRMTRPSGANITPTNQNRIYTPDATGPHAVLVHNSSLGSGAFTIRVNNVAAPEPVALGPLQERTATLALGQVRRYSLGNLTQGQVLALSLDTPTTLDVTAVVEGGAIYDPGVVLTGSAAPRSGFTGPRYVQQSSPGTVIVYSASTTVGNATGQFTLGLQSPAPLAATLAAPIGLTTATRNLHLYSFNLTSAGRHLLCTTYPGTGGASAIVFGPSAPFVNYGGDLSASGSTPGRDEQFGDLRIGLNTLSITGATGNAVTARLASVAAPAAITVNAAALATNIASPCERRYFSFAGVAGQSYTVRATAAFAGSLRARKLAPGEWTERGDPPFGTLNLPGSPTTLAAGVERVLTFTIPNNSTFGNGTYLVEVDADDDAVGNFSVQVTAP